MADNAEEKFNTKNINGLDLRFLKGGFVAFVHNRIPEAEEVNNLDDSKLEEIFTQEREIQHLLCKKCGTVIHVHPPGRIAKCCKEEMIPLVEIPAETAEVEQVLVQEQEQEQELVQELEEVQEQAQMKEQEPAPMTSPVESELEDEPEPAPETVEADETAEADNTAEADELDPMSIMEQAHALDPTSIMAQAHGLDPTPVMEQAHQLSTSNEPEEKQVIEPVQEPESSPVTAERELTDYIDAFDVLKRLRN